MAIAHDVGTTNYELLGLLKNFDDHFAWSQFMDIYTPLIRNCCLGWNLHPHEVDDVQSMVNSRLMAIFTSSELRIHTSFRGFLAKIVENEIRTFRKARASDRHVPMGTMPHLVAPTPSSSQSHDELDRVETLMREQLRRISIVLKHIRLRVNDKTWQIYWDYAVLGQNVEDVANQFGVSSSTVFKSHQRVTRVIREVTQKLALAW